MTFIYLVLKSSGYELNPFICLWVRVVVCLANNCCIANTLEAVEERFLRLYKRKAMLHHYDKFINARCATTCPLHGFEHR